MGRGGAPLTVKQFYQKVFFAVVYGSVAFGYSLSELSTFGVASASARHVFGVIDKVGLGVTALAMMMEDICKQMSAIDPASGTGERPESLAGNIEFSNVVFSYPSRPDVQVMFEAPGVVVCGI